MYLIPRNVVSRFEFFPGFGWRELGLTIAAAAVGGVLAFAAFFLPLAARVMLFVVPPAAAYFAGRPMPDGMSLYVLLRRFRAWKREQRTYLYIAGRGQ